MKLVQLGFSFLCVLWSIYATPSFSQAKTGVFAGGSIMYYNGDLDDKTNEVFTNSDFFNACVSIGVSQWLTGRMEGSLTFVHGKVNGADSLSKEQNHLARNLSFESDIDEVSVHFEFTAFHRYERRRFNPYFLTGASVFRFNPKAKLNGSWYELQPLGTEGQNIVGDQYAKPYKLTQFAVPLGFGVGVLLSRHFRLKVEFNHRLLFTDYLDDVSTVYPDLESISSTANGEIAAALSSRRLNGKHPGTNKQRGNAKYNDAYTTIGFTLIYNPGIMRCPASFRSTKIKRT
jgi:Domain of unknown function (DUF6089)